MELITKADKKKESGLVEYLDYFKHQYYDFLVFEIVPNGDLYSYVSKRFHKKQYLSMNELKNIAFQVSIALAFLES